MNEKLGRRDFSKRLNNASNHVNRYVHFTNPLWTTLDVKSHKLDSCDPIMNSDASYPVYEKRLNSVFANHF